MFDITGKYSTAKVFIDNIEALCHAQINKFLNHPAFTNPIAIMPDTHAGKGSVIGFTMRMGPKLIPNVIGFDIGCRMLSFPIALRGDADFDEIEKRVREAVPMGFNVHEKDPISWDAFPWKETNTALLNFITQYKETTGKDFKVKRLYDKGYLKESCALFGMSFERTLRSLGTLGGGNHFIELGRSENTGDLWLTVHSGSRQLGKVVCDYYQKLAHKINQEKGKSIEVRINDIKNSEPDRTKWNKLINHAKNEMGRVKKSDLDYLEGPTAQAYLHDMFFAQAYASKNCHLIMSQLLKAFDVAIIGEGVNTIHNYIDPGDFVIRKGATSSYKGKRMIIPLNMRDGILLCEGTSNPEANFSAPHGAGRVMSRTQAKKELNLVDVQEQMKDIHCTINKNVLDEAPDAYKDSALIEGALGPLATIIDRIKPIQVFKDINGGKRA